jgi:hypothetical protein
MSDLIYSHRNEKNKKVYYLHRSVNKKGGYLFYFSQEIVGGVSLPEGYEVRINTYSGLPYLKKYR